MKSKKNLVILLFLLILGVGVFLRTYKLDSNPSGFFCDEAENGYISYSIIRTGRDNYDVFLPFFFRALGDFRDPVYIYTTAPIFLFFAPTEVGVRMGSVIYGVATCIALFFLIKKQFSRDLAILVLLAIALCPWHIHYSRTGFQLIASAFWVTISMYFWTIFCDSNSKKSFFAFIATSFLAIFTYFPMKIVLPVFWIAVLIFDPKILKKTVMSKFNIAVIVFFIGMAVMAIYPYLQDGSFFARLHAVKEPGRGVQTIVSSYFAHFDYGFLFRHGEYGYRGSFISRQSQRDYGELHEFQFLPIILGFGFALWEVLSSDVQQKKKRNLMLYILLLLAYPFSSAITTMIPSATHSIIGVIPFSFFTGYGIYALAEIARSRGGKRWFGFLVYSAFGVFWIVSTGYYFLSLMRYPVYSSDYDGWQYGYRQAMERLGKQSDLYDHLYITHRYNAGEALLRAYKTESLCEKCKVMNNPIEIDNTKKELFAVRLDDIKEAEIMYPDLSFVPKDKILVEGGLIELWIGEFERDIRSDTY